MRIFSKLISLILLLGILLSLTSICQAASISGTVTNNTGQTGRIYIKATPTDWGGDWSYGISIPAGGSYTISGLPDSFNGGYTQATYILSAFVDTQGNGVQHANDPAVTLGTPVIIGSTSANLTLATPTPVAPQANEIIAYQGNGGNTVIWYPYETDSGLPIADKYVVSWNTSESDSGASTREVPSGRDSYLFFHNGGGTNLYYKVTAYVGATPASTGWVPVTTRSTGVTVSGAVTLSGVGTSKPLIVLIKQEVPGQYPVFYSNIIPSPSTSGANSYSISNVPAGTYSFHAFLDVNGDGVHGPGDLDYQPSIYSSEEVVVGSSNTTGISPTITQRNADATIRTSNWTSDGSNFNKNLGFTVESQAKQPVNVYVSGGGLQDNTPVGNNNEGEFRIWPGLNGITPVTGNTYTYTVQYSDSTSEQFTVSVGNFLTSFAGNLSPTGTVPYTNGIPTFSWSAPASPPSPYHYYLWLSGADASWNTDDLPSTQTSILYNADEEASKTTLTAGVPYSWTAVVSDRYGNQAAYQTSFTMSSSAGTISFTGRALTPAGPSPLQGVSIAQESNPGNTTTSGVDGSFTLNNLPASTPFRLVMTYPGLVPVYTQYFNSATSFDVSNTPYYFLTQANLGLTSGKGAIVATLVDGSTGQALSGVTATAPGYTVLYLNGSEFTGTSTNESGIIKILDVTPNTNVTITPSKTGYTFSPQIFSVPADSVLEAGIFGSAAPTSVSFTGKTVIAGSGGTPLTGVVIAQVDPSNSNTPTGNSTASDSNGSFTLTNLPTSTYFRLLMTVSGYMPVYSQRFNYPTAVNVDWSNFVYFLSPVGSIPLQSGTGVIFARLIDISTQSPLVGATAAVTDGYTVQYRNVAANNWSGTATDSSGLIRILNVPPNTNISLAPVKSGYTFSNAPYSVAVFAADSATEINLFANPGTTYTLGVQRSGSGSGTTQVQVNGLAAPPCSGTSCSYGGIPGGASVQLTAIPDTGSSFSAWTNCPSGTSVCSFTLSADTTVSATFGLQPFKVDGLATYYDSLLAAFSGATTGQKILGQKSFEAPATTFNRSTSTDQLTFKGGYDDSFSDSRGTTDFSTVGPLTIQSGSLVLDQVIIK